MELPSTIPERIWTRVATGGLVQLILREFLYLASGN